MSSLSRAFLGSALQGNSRSRTQDSAVSAETEKSVPGEVAADLQPGDMLITLGAGDVTRLGPEILKELESKG